MRADALAQIPGAYAPRSSGLLSGGGLRHFRRRKSAIKGWGKHFPDRHLSDYTRIREDVPDFDPALEFDYTSRELKLLAEKILICDPKPPGAEPMVLTGGMLRERTAAEIYTTAGTPDPSIIEGMYWRTHPLGRAWRTVEEMEAAAGGFYKQGQVTANQVTTPVVRRERAYVGHHECACEGCPRDAATKGLCQRHYMQRYKGERLRPIRDQKLTEAQRQEVRETRGNGETHAEVAARYGVSQGYTKRLRMGEVGKRH